MRVMAAPFTYWTPSEAAQELRVSVASIYRNISSGKIRAVRVGSQWRILAADATRAAADSRPSPYQWMREIEDRRDDRVRD
jgi:excisionase family DNA binding protein